jgi:hypothetical protein
VRKTPLSKRDNRCIRKSQRAWPGMTWSGSRTSSELASLLQLYRLSLHVAGFGFGDESACQIWSSWMRLIQHWNMRMRKRLIDACWGAHPRVWSSRLPSSDVSASTLSNFHVRVEPWATGMRAAGMRAAGMKTQPPAV